MANPKRVNSVAQPYVALGVGGASGFGNTMLMRSNAPVWVKYAAPAAMVLIGLATDYVTKGKYPGLTSGLVAGNAAVLGTVAGAAINSPKGKGGGGGYRYKGRFNTVTPTQAVVKEQMHPRAAVPEAAQWRDILTQAVALGQSPDNMS